MPPSRRHQGPKHTHPLAPPPWQVGIIFGGCFGRLFAEVLVAAKLLDASAPGIVGMYALMGAGEGGRARPGA